MINYFHQFQLILFLAISTEFCLCVNLQLSAGVRAWLADSNIASTSLQEDYCGQ